MPAYHYQQGDQPLDGFTIQHALGRGGFGEVYFAISDAGREVALKAVQNYEEIELRGIGHCMNLKSPHLVMIFDVKQGDDGTPWVIMEYVSGASLRDILDASPEGIGPEQATFFVRELAKGIDYLHEAGIVHRDLKPHNVFFEDGVVKIGDYSLSKVITHSHASGHTMTVGSVHYMAPEISMGRYDKTVDLYALGVMLYEMLTGKPPFVGESVGEVLMKHLSGSVDVSGLDEPFAGVVRKALDRDPTKRFQSAREMADALIGNSAATLQDSIPASLSLVGKRPPAPMGEPTRDIQSASRQPQLDTIGPAEAINDTAESERPTRQHHLGDGGATDLPKMANIRYLSRVALSLISTIALLSLAFFLSTDVGFGDGLTFFAAAILFIGVWTTAVLIAWILIVPAPRETGFYAATVSRIFLLALWAVCFLGIRFLDDQSPLYEILKGCFLGAIASTMILDWRAFTNLRRSARMLTARTLVAGGISGAVAALADQSFDHAILAMASTTSAAITVQLISFWHAPGGSPGKSSKDFRSDQHNDLEAPQNESTNQSFPVESPTSERVA